MTGLPNSANRGYSGFCPKNQNVPVKQRGYILVTVMVAAFLVATLAFLMSQQSAISSNLAAADLEADEARYVAEAGVEHALWQVRQANCSNYANLTNEPFGDHSYSVVVSPSDGSPVALQSTATLASGASATFQRAAVPVYSTTATASLSLQPGPAGEDTYIRDGANDSNNFGAAAILKLNNQSAEEASLLKFDLSSIPAAAQVSSATLELWLAGGQGLSNGVIDVHRVTQTWVEGDKDGQAPVPGTGATYNSYNGQTNWASPGGDYATPPLDTVTIPVLAQGWHQWDLTSTTQVWVAGTTANNGVLLRASAGNVDKIYFTSGDGTAAENPKLTVTYACECGDVCAAGSGAEPIILSTDSNAELGGLSFSDKDLAEYDMTADSATLFLDGAALGLAQDIDALHVLSNGHIMLSAINTITLGGVTAENEDLIEYDPVTDTGVLIFDGSELFTSGSTDISAVHVLGNGNLLLTNEYSATLGGISFQPNDIVEYNPATDSATMFIDGSAVGLSGWINALHRLDNGNLVLSTNSADTLGGLSFGTGDLVEYDPALDSATLFMDGGLFADPENVRSVHVGPGSGGESGGGANLLLVVGDAGGLTAQEQARKSLIESWGYAVNIIDVDDSQPAFDMAVAANDVVYISDTITEAALGTKLTSATIGIVNESIELNVVLGFSGSSANSSRNEIDIIDNSHPITTGFALGLTTITDSLQRFTYFFTDTAPGQQVLAETSHLGPQYKTSFVTLETGAELWGGGNAAGRRVQLPWGEGTFDINALNADGLTLLQRSIEWAANAEGATGPIAHWKLDDGTGTTAVDSEGGHDGTLANGPVWVAGKFDAALEFTGGTEYVDLTSDAALDDVFVGGATVMAWIYPDDWGDNGYGRIFDKSSSPSSTGDGWAIRLNKDNDGLNFGQGFSGGRGWWKLTSTVVNLDTWQHVAIAYDASSVSNDPIVFLNGSAVAVTRVDTPSGDVRSDASINLRLGNHAGGTSHTFKGVIDDVRIYDRMLSATEIAELASPTGTSPIAHWKMDDAGGTTAVDSAGGHDGTLVNGPSWVFLGKVGGALGFDGSNDYVSVPDDSTLSLTNTMTFTAWINASSFGASYQTILAKDAGGSGSNYYFGTWQQELVFGFFAGGLFREVFTSGLDLQAGTWYHLGATFDDAADTVRLYVDGAEVVNGTLSFSPSVVAADLTIGRSPDGENWRGQLDDVRIYDELLSQSDIAELAAAGSGGGSGGGGGGSSCDGTFRDEFNTKTYSANDGTLTWATDWLEVGESNGPTSGDEQVVRDLSDFQLRTQDNDNGGEGAEREADLSGAASATLSYDFRRNNLDDSGDYTTVEISSSGASGPWSELARHEGPGSDADYQSASHDILAFVSGNTRIRFKTSPNMGKNDSVFFDNVEIRCTP